MLSDREAATSALERAKLMRPSGELVQEFGLPDPFAAYSMLVGAMIEDLATRLLRADAVIALMTTGVSGGRKEG